MRQKLRAASFPCRSHSTFQHCRPAAGIQSGEGMFDDETLRQLIDPGTISTSDTVPVVCAEKLFPKQGNQFGFAVTKTCRLRDWLEQKDGKVRLSPEKAEQRGQRYG